MKNRILKYGFLFVLLSVVPARADIEALLEGLEQITVFESENETLQTIESLYNKAEELKKQASEYKNKAEKMYHSAQDAANKGIDAVNKASEMVKTGDIKGAIQNMDFAPLQGMFDGSKGPAEEEEAVYKEMVREEGDHSIENQRELEKAINEKEGIEMADTFAKAIVMRKNIEEETDELENPQTEDEALSLAQDEYIRSIKRRNRMVALEATRLSVRASRELAKIEAKKEGENE